MHQSIHIIKWAASATSSKRRQQAFAGRPRLLINTSLLAAVVILALVSSPAEAIVKQQQQQQQQASQQQQVSQQSRSDEPQLLGAHGLNGQQQAPGAYNHHQSSGISSPSGQQQQQQQQQQPSGSIQSNYGQQAGNGPSSSGISMSSSVSSSSSSSAAIPNSGPASSGSGRNTNGLMMQPVHQQQQQLDQQMNGYQSANAAANNNQKPLSSVSPPASYLDSMATAANNPDQSYQAAAQSVNMALANSGIYNSANYAAPQQQQQQPQSQSQYSGSASSLNPLHYFYYPAKDQAQGVGSSGQFSNNYADQLGSVLSPLSGSGSGASISPEAAASNQDASYLPQPMMDNNNSNNNNNNQPTNQYSQINGQQQQSYGADLSAYASGNQQQPSTITFNGPASANSQQQQPSQQQQQQQQNYNQQLSANDFMNSHLGHGQQTPQQQTAGAPSYPSASLFNGLADLSTSNFGNNAGLSSVASYMAPNGNSALSSQQPAQGAHDLFGSGAFGQQFNSAASQLNPAAVPAPPQSPTSGAASSLFGAASSLFGGSQSASNGPNQQQQQPSSIFSGQHYLGSFLSPQQFASNSDQQQLSAASNPSLTSLAPSTSSGSSGKRFGISSFIMPMLALAGLSLLIPTMSNIGTAVGRKKRSIIEERASASSRQQEINYNSMNGSNQVAKEASIGEYLDRIERYYSIYKNAVESDDCLNRLICEFGDAVKDITGKSAVVTVIEKLVPNWMTGKIHLFKEAALDNKDGKEKCKKYICHSSRQH